MGLLDGKRALITGARKGIGRGIALTLAKEGANVGLNDLLDDEVTQESAKVCADHGAKATVHQGDVSSVAGVNAVIDAFTQEHGGIDMVTLANATWQLVRNRGEIRTGASTITMQLVKNSGFLSTPSNTKLKK